MVVRGVRRESLTFKRQNQEACRNELSQHYKFAIESTGTLLKMDGLSLRQL